MKKYFSKQHADLYGGAMETGDHFKNGASPKSQMSRGYLDYFYASLLLLAVSFCSCENSIEALQTVNRLAEAKGQAPISNATQAEIRTAINNLYLSVLNKEGLTFARLKRMGVFLQTLSPYGAQDRHEWLPIPVSEFTANPNMTQNPGW
jgi:hypothetical protein